METINHLTAGDRRISGGSRMCTGLLIAPKPQAIGGEVSFPATTAKRMQADLNSRTGFSRIPTERNP